jgi:hypothetical protein
VSIDPSRLVRRVQYRDDLVSSSRARIATITMSFILSHFNEVNLAVRAPAVGPNRSSPPEFVHLPMLFS